MSAGHTALSSIDPDCSSSSRRAFARWLRASMEEINAAGRSATVDETRMDIHVSNL